MRALIATAGLLVLVGTAAAADTPTPRTLVRSGSGPIAGIAQDGATIAWLSRSVQGCNTVRLRLPNRKEQALPTPSAGSMTCHWNLAEGQPLLALAAKSSTALWTLHENGSAPYDYVMSAQAGGAEHQVDRIGRASDGTGLWLGGVAGAGTTLAYSYADVEYVDPTGCLSGGSCKKEIAGGGVKLVDTTGQVTVLSGAGPALEIAASNGRIAYVAAASVGKSGKPLASATAPIDVVNVTDGSAVAQVQPDGTPLAIALSHHLLTVLVSAGKHDRVSWYELTDGKRMGTVSISASAAPQLAASDSYAVFRVGRTLRGVVLGNKHLLTLAKAAATPLDLSLQNRRLAWAENLGSGGRIRVLSVG